MYRCFEYGCTQPTEGLAEAIEQMRLRNVLWNNLVEIDRMFKPKREALLRVPAQEELEQCLTDLAELRKKLKAAKKKLPKRAATGDEVTDLISRIDDGESRVLRLAAILGIIADGTLTATENKKAERKALYAKIKEQRKARAVEMKASLKAIEDERRAAVKETRKTSNLYWVNHDEVLENFDIARVRAMKEGAELHFHRWGGSGKITVRLDKDPRMIQLEASWQSEWTARKERRHNCKIPFRIRTTNADKKLVAVATNVFLHRPIPADVSLRTASLIRERIADNFRWKLVVSVALPDPQPKSGGIVSVTLRHLRPVAMWEGSDGRSGMVILPERLIGTFHKCEELQSLIDQKFNAARSMLVEWLKGQRKVPAWLREKTEALALWRSPGRLVWLVKNWEHFRNDRMIFAALEAWKIDNIHLWEWKRNLEDQNVKARREEYRKFAARLVSSYSTLRITKQDLAAKKRRPEPEVDKPVIGGRTRDIAAHGLLRQILMHTFQREGGKIEDSEAFAAERQSANFEMIEAVAGD